MEILPELAQVPKGQGTACDLFQGITLHPENQALNILSLPSPESFKGQSKSHTEKQP